MPRERTAYDILDLPRTAATSQIRVRYRQLVRRYQAARSTEQLFEDDKFLELVRSFLLLDSPRRREYDRLVQGAKGQPVPRPDLLAPLSPTDRVLLAADVAFIRSELQEATTLARTVVEASPRDARAWALLGEILVGQHKYEEAVSALNFAIQFAPSEKRYWDLLNEATALREGRLPPKQAAEMPLSSERRVYAWVALAVSLAAAVAGVVWLAPKIQITWYVYWLAIPVGPLVVGGADGLLLGLVLALVRLLDRFDDEMLGEEITYEVQGGQNLSLVPLGLYLIPAGVICFWLALASYAVIAYLNERLSPSVTLALGLTAVVTGLMTALEPNARWGVVILAGNATYAGMMLGWFLGTLGQNLWRKVD